VKVEFAQSIPDLRASAFSSPEPHVHLAVHRRRGGQVLSGLLQLARAPKEPGETEVATGDEGVHLQLLGERERVRT